MNKKALKDFAVYARNELRRQIALRAQTFGITPGGSPQIEEGTDYLQVNGQKYPKSQKQTFEKLFSELEHKGYDQLLEEVAYTWFNRIIALRYMEVHRYLPSRIRVLSSETKGKVDPDLLTEYRYAGLPIQEQEISELLEEGKRDEAFRTLLISQCNDLNEIMPFLFEKLADYSELLLPDNLLHADSIINKLVLDLEEDNFDHVEVIGWLYQYYISEKKDEVFAGLKKNQKITKENIPAATQLFTPNWIVRYMVENSLGHMWLESHENSNLNEHMKYYIEPAKQELEVQSILDELKNPNLSPESITIMDPACGSGHILVYAFDLLYKIYEEQGYPARDIPILILEKNLYGIDIDERAAQLASFALMMKAREKSKRILKNPPMLNVLSIKESNEIKVNKIVEFLAEEDLKKSSQLKSLFGEFIDAKHYGSILKPENIDYDFFIKRLKNIKYKGLNSLFEVEVGKQFNEVEGILRQGKLLSSQYDVVVTNPPYMGLRGMNSTLNKYVKKHYKESKNDLFAVFMERLEHLTKDYKYHVTVTMQSWMFLSTYEMYRKHLIEEFSISSMVHMGNNVMNIAFGTAAAVLRKKVSEIKGTFQYISQKDMKDDEPSQFPVFNNRFCVVDNSNFNDIPGAPIAYWASEKIRKAFTDNVPLGNIAQPRQGLATSDNNRFLRFWHEVKFTNIGFGFPSAEASRNSENKWFPYNKGGSYRKWYGNQQYVVNWYNNGEELKEWTDYLNKIQPPMGRLKNRDFYFKEGITWSFVSSTKFGVRYTPVGFIFDIGGSSLFPQKELIYYINAFLSSKLTFEFLQYLNPTISFQIGNISSLPIKLDSKIKEEIDGLSISNIEISKSDWNHFEDSWNFLRHPFLTYDKKSKLIGNSFTTWKEHAENKFHELQNNEEEINRIFIDLYGLEGEITSDVSDNEVTILLANRERDAKSFLSYCVGLMMGRYSLDIEGLAYAGGQWVASHYKSFTPDENGIIPLTSEAYFEDDVILRLEELLKVIYGDETLQENLYWLAESLTMRGNETPTERLRRYFFEEFYKDHCKIYQKRPIYWMAESGKKKGFRALFYLHRYTPETLATMRFGYVQNLQEKLRQEEKRLETVLINPDLSSTERKRMDKHLATLRGQQEELVEFDLVLAEYANERIELDLDDGVVENYKKLGNVVATIK